MTTSLNRILMRSFDVYVSFSEFIYSAQMATRQRK